MVEIREFNEKEFQNYVGHADIPKKRLVDQINNAQKKRAAHQERAKAAETIDPEDLTSVGKVMFAALDLAQYLIPLVFVHAGLNILVRLQYGHDTPAGEIMFEACSTIPVMGFVHILGHPHRDERWFRIVSFFASVFIGMYLIYSSFEEGYYMVMARAPPLGTIWIWLLFEMSWEWCATVLVVLAAFMWRKGYEL